MPVIHTLINLRHPSYDDHGIPHPEPNVIIIPPLKTPPIFYKPTPIHVAPRTKEKEKRTPMHFILWTLFILFPQKGNRLTQRRTPNQTPFAYVCTATQHPHATWQKRSHNNTSKDKLIKKKCQNTTQQREIKRKAKKKKKLELSVCHQRRRS